MTKTGILLIDCPDRKGIAAAVADFLYQHNANILHADQHKDVERDLFLMRVEWDLAALDLSLDDCARQFAAIAERFQMRWRIERSDQPHRLALFVSKYDHCLVDLLYRHQSGELICDIAVVISNHAAAKRWADFYAVPFFHVPVEPGHKAEAEARQLAVLEDYGVNLVVLARYMQVLSPQFVDRFPQRIINVHHSFLPAFSGARPYHRALERGVKLIGATSHYVTQDLDEGPLSSRT
jgi:formyltetrahydrofolate deformylase